MPKSWRWMEGFSDWLIEIPFSDSDITSDGDLWCKYCKKPVKRKKYNAIKHATTAKHLKAYEARYISKTKRESNEQLIHINYNESDRLGIESSPDMEESLPRDSHAKRHKKEMSSSYDFPTMSYPDHVEEFNEVDAFARSIAAQMKTLPEKYIIGLTFDIQNLVTQKRLQALEDKTAEKQASLQAHVITVSSNASAPTMEPTASTYYQ